MGRDEVKELMSAELFGLSRKAAWEAGICISCKETALPRCYSDAGRNEYYISALCELCFDKIMREEK